MEPTHQIPRSNTPSGLPETWEGFEQLKQERRHALRSYWDAQSESARQKELERIIVPKPPGYEPEPFVGMEVF